MAASAEVTISKDDDLEELMDPEDVARIIGVAPHTLAIWASTGRYRLAFVKVGRKRKYRPRDVKTFINERRREPGKAAS